MALRLLRTNYLEQEYKTRISHYRAKRIERGYPETLIMTTLPETLITTTLPPDERVLSFVTKYRLTVPSLKQILMQEWYLIQ